ncbi:MAG: pilus assembly protein [Candidatus Eremiobacteraeota bacterium]|nr:pilus assembly protein [Candidatus Eremiobacteraeota bacterium]
MRHYERGGSLVEFALVASAFMLLVTGVIYLGLLVYSYTSVSNAARLAARWASVRGADCVAGSSNGCPATQSNIQSYVIGQLPGVVTSPPPTVTPTWTTPPWSSSPSGCSSASETAGCLVKVTITYSFPLTIPFYGPVPAYTATSESVVAR